MQLTVPAHVLLEFARLAYRARKAKRRYLHLSGEKVPLSGAESIIRANTEWRDAMKELNKFKSKTIKLW